MDEGAQLGAIAQIALAVRDLDKQVEFYRDVLRLPFLFSAPPGLAFFDCGGVRLLLDRAPEAEPVSGNSILYFRVADISATHQALTARGVAFVEEPRIIHKAPDHDLWMAFFRDPEGNAQALMSEVPRA